MKFCSLFAVLIVLVVSACAQTPDIDITPAKKLIRNNDPFMEALRVGYLEFYDFENSKNNKEKARLYARKALATSRGMAPAMEGLFNRDIPLERLNALLGAKYFTESAFANGTKEIAPNASAQAQLMFDCWTDQEEIRHKKRKAQQEATTSCHTEFNQARRELDNALLDIKQQERAREQALIEKETKRITAYHKQELSRALAQQKRELRKLPEYSLIFFKFNDTRLGITGMNILDKVAKDIALFSPRKVIISGNTDLVGGYEYNMKLAMARGNVAANYLIQKHNINKNMLDVKAYGQNNPRNNPSKTSKDVRNRYVQIIFEVDNKFYPSEY